MGRTRKPGLQRDHLDQKFAELRSQNLASPPRGWLRAIRESLGMSVAQLASRVGVPRQNISRIEQSEKNGHVSVATLKRVAEALSCDLYVTLVPRPSLQSI